MLLDSDFCELFIESRMTRNECADYLDVSLSTLRRWLNTSQRPPRSVFIAMKSACGHVVFFSEFKGWKFKNGLLITDDGLSYSAGDIRAIFYDKQYITALRSENSRLKHKLAELSEKKQSDNIINFSDYLHRKKIN